MDTAVDQLDRLIEHLEARLERLRRVRNIIAEDPAMKSDLLGALLDEPTTFSNTERPLVVHRTGQPLPERIKAFFMSNGNEWRTVRQIMDGTGLNRNTVNSLLYTSKHKDQFEWRQRGEHRKVWRIKADEATILPLSPQSPDASSASIP